MVVFIVMEGYCFVCQVGDISSHKSESHTADLHTAALNEYSNGPPSSSKSLLPSSYVDRL